MPTGTARTLLGPKVKAMVVAWLQVKMLGSHLIKCSSCPSLEYCEKPFGQKKERRCNSLGPCFE
jgi:hypothetical protein